MHAFVTDEVLSSIIYSGLGFKLTLKISKKKVARQDTTTCILNAFLDVASSLVVLKPS